MINFFFIFLDLFKVYIFKMVFMRFVDFKSEIFFFVDENQIKKFFKREYICFKKFYFFFKYEFLIFINVLKIDF